MKWRRCFRAPRHAPGLTSQLVHSLLTVLSFCPGNQALLLPSVLHDARLLSIQPAGPVKLNPVTNRTDINVTVTCRLGTGRNSDIKELQFSRILDNAWAVQTLATAQVTPFWESVIHNVSGGVVAETESGDGFVLTLVEPSCADQGLYRCTAVRNDPQRGRLPAREGEKHLNFTKAPGPLTLSAVPNRTAWKPLQMLTLTCRIVLSLGSLEEDDQDVAWSWDYQDPGEGGKWHPVDTNVTAWGLRSLLPCDMELHSNVLARVITPMDHRRTYRCSARVVNESVAHRSACFFVGSVNETAMRWRPQLASSLAVPPVTDVLFMLSVAFVVVASVWMASSYYYSRRFDKTLKMVRKECDEEARLSLSSSHMQFPLYASSSDLDAMNKHRHSKDDFPSSSSRQSAPNVAPWKIGNEEVKLQREPSLTHKMIRTLSARFNALSEEGKEVDGENADYKDVAPSSVSPAVTAFASKFSTELRSLNSPRKSEDGRKTALAPAAPPPVTITQGPRTARDSLRDSVVELPADHALLCEGTEFDLQAEGMTSMNSEKYDVVEDRAASLHDVTLSQVENTPESLSPEHAHGSREKWAGESEESQNHRVSVNSASSGSSRHPDSESLSQALSDHRVSVNSASSGSSRHPDSESLGKALRNAVDFFVPGMSQR